MSEKRFTIKVQGDWFGIVDNYSADKVCVINGIRTEIEAEWLCDLLNNLHEENIRLKKDFDSCSHNWALLYDEAKKKVEALTKENWELERENEKLENRLWKCQNVR